MRIIWTRSTVLGPFGFIEWALDEPVSHVAIELDGIVGHSTWSKGVDILPLSELLRSRKVVYQMDIPATIEEEIHFLDRVQERIDRSYDFRFFFWLVWRGILKKLLKRPVPDKIEVESSYTVLCTEILDMLPDDIRPKYDRTRATTPYKLFIQLGG